MANLRKWSQTATGNATVAGGASTINFAEGQLPSTVNNSAREMMAQIRGVYKPSEWGWVECSATASVASQTTFKLTGDQTGDYTAGRRWRIKSASTTRYGSIVSSSYTTETTVTVTVDSGSLSASHTLAAVAAIDNNHIPSNTYLTSASLVTSLASYITSNSVSVALSAYVTSSSLATALSPYITSNSVSAAIAAAATSGTMVWIGHDAVNGSGSTVFSSIPQYTAIILLVNSATTGVAQDVTVEISNDNGGTYGSARVITTTGAAGGSICNGSVHISNTKSNGSNKTITPKILTTSDVDATFARSTYTTVATENVKTGIVDAIRIATSSGTTTFQVTAYGIV